MLTPTRIYVRQILETIRGTGAVKALAHITGGGLTDNIPRVLPPGLAAEIDLGAFALPPVFAWLKQEARLDQDEMLRTFNCGIGMIVIVGPGDVEPVLGHLGDEAKVIGAIGERGRGAAGPLHRQACSERVVTKKRVGVLISGRGSNLQALIEACKAPDYPAKIVLVVSNVPGAQGLLRAEASLIPALVIDHTGLRLARSLRRRARRGADARPA